MTDLSSTEHGWGQDGFLDNQLREFARDISFEYKFTAAAGEIALASGLIGKVANWFKGKLKNVVDKIFKKDTTKHTNYQPTQSAKRFDMNKVDEYADQMKSEKWDWDNMRDPVIVDSKGNIMSGHHRILAAEKAGIKIPEKAIIRIPKETVRPVYSWDDILQ